MAETADVVVVGLGAMGAATLHALARSGVRAVGIDRYHPPHDLGSTHGESRITRLAVGEGTAYAPLVRRSHEIWREIEAETGEQLMLQTGGLIIGSGEPGALVHGHADFVGRTIAVAEQHAIAHEALDADAIARRFPQLGLRGDERACYEPSAGLVFPERCVAAQLRLAERCGATLRLGERVLLVQAAGSGVVVTTDRGALHTGRVLAAGAAGRARAGAAAARAPPDPALVRARGRATLRTASRSSSGCTAPARRTRSTASPPCPARTAWR